MMVNRKRIVTVGGAFDGVKGACERRGQLGRKSFSMVRSCFLSFWLVP